MSPTTTPIRSNPKSWSIWSSNLAGASVSIIAQDTSLREASATRPYQGLMAPRGPGLSALEARAGKLFPMRRDAVAEVSIVTEQMSILGAEPFLRTLPSDYVARLADLARHVSIP